MNSIAARSAVGILALVTLAMLIYVYGWIIPISLAMSGIVSLIVCNFSLRRVITMARLECPKWTPEQIVERWNAVVGVGDVIEYQASPFTRKLTISVGSNAALMNGTAVVFLNGHGYVAVERCRIPGALVQPWESP
jgi:hypothetical protein